jgi:4-amino-4-deoxy-L-arabinose transferase-like glycosyltransferase
VVDEPLRADAGEYFAYAYNLHNYGVYSLHEGWLDPPPRKAPTADKVRSPGYPLFLLAAGPPHPNAGYGLRINYLQACMGVASVLLIFLIAAQFLPAGWALAAAALTAISPHLATMNTYLLTEPLFTFFLLAATWSVMRAAASRKSWMFALSGLLWAAASLVRPTTQFFPVLLLALVFVLPSLRSYRRPALVGTAVFALALSPWFIRNLSVPAAGPGSNLMVNTLAHGSYPDFMYQGRPETFAYPYRADPDLPKFTGSLAAVLGHIAENFKAHPLEQARWYLLGKPYFFLSLRDVQSADVLIYPSSRMPFYDSPAFSMLRVASNKIHWPLMLLALAGIFVVLLRPRMAELDPVAKQAATILALLVAYAIAFHMVVAPFPRYAIPFRPALFALAMLGLQLGWKALGDRKS